MLLDKFQYCPACGSKDFRVNDERSKKCANCGFTFYINASGAYVAIITNSRGELLVLRRRFEPAKGTLDLPGGFADPGETAEEGIRREVMEETGLEVTSSQYLFSYPNRYEYSGMTIPTIDLFFRCEVADDTIVTASDDADEYYWIPLSEVRPKEIGLMSIRRGVERFLAEHK